MSKLTLTCMECGRTASAEGERDEPDRELRAQGWLTFYPAHCQTCECFSVLCPVCRHKQRRESMQ